MLNNQNTCTQNINVVYEPRRLEKKWNDFNQLERYLLIF